NNPPRDDLALLQALVKNRIVTDAYEPGSTFKVVTLSAALDSGAVNLSSTFDCPGFKMVNGERIKCWKNSHGHQTLEEAVRNSCNPAFMTMALAMGKETFYDYIYRFGFGSSTESGLTGESGGIVIHQKYVRENNIARIGFGQSVAVTPMQLAAAVCAAVNGGELMQPYIVKQVIGANGEIIKENKPTVVRQVISEETSATVRSILESVVAEGSGRNAQI
ncbi:MAG: penicillin-binding transpeptidase domain-containing protein, partial [Bacillota bacterium]